MIDADCRRWIALSDREALREPLSDVDSAWLRQHGSECPHCGTEQRLWLSMAGIMGNPELLDAEASDRPDKLPSASSQRPPRGFDRRLAWGLGLAAGLAFTIVGVAQLVRGRPPQSAAMASMPAAQLLSVAGEVHVGTRVARAGDMVGDGERLITDQGRVCVGIAGSITTCLDAVGGATLSLADPAQIVVQLDHGRVMSRLDRQPTNRRFTVKTASASITARGTQFLVSVDSEQKTTVHLHEGSLAIRNSGNISGDLTAPAQATVARELRIEPWSEQAAEEDRVLGSLAGLPRTGQRTLLEVVTKPAGATVTVDDLVLGPAPVSALLGEGHHLNVALAGYAPVNELLPTTTTEVLQRSFELSPLPPPSVVEREATDDVKPMVAAKVRPSGAGNPGQLLTHAQLLRSEGRYRDCAAVYRQLIVRHPHSDEARVSLVSLGELELSELSQPDRALRDFENYLRIPGPLAREARFARIRALRALSRSREEQSATAAFLQDYPNSVQAESLRHKLQTR